MNVKKGFLFLLIIAALCPLGAQQEKDVILVVDTASSMFSYYNEVGRYLSGPFLAENVAVGDTLHIISFGSKPRFEIARRILGTGDIETAGARIWLLYPLDPASDSGAAINYAEQYVRSIQGGRQKKVFIVSDTDLSAEAEAVSERLGPVEVRFIQAGSRMGSGRTPSAVVSRPSAASPARTPAQTSSTGAAARPPAAQPARAETGRQDAASSTTTTRQTDPVQQTVPARQAAAVPQTGTVAGTSVTGTTGAETTDPGTTNAGPAEQSLGAEPAGVSGAAGIAGAGALGAGAVGAGTAGTTGSAGAAGSASEAPRTEAAAGTDASAGAGIGALEIPQPLLVALLLLLLLVIVLFIVFRMRSLHSSPKKAMAEFRSGGTAANDADLLNSFASRQAEAALQRPRPYRYRNDANQILTKPAMLNIFVEEQNTAIGRRNIHALKQGATYSVGGGNSDFLIFLVKFPASIGRLSFDGTNCTFTPLKGEFFPDIGSHPVTECIGKTIRAISKMNYEVFFHFEPYRDPLLVMNELLNSIKVPEPPAAEG